MACHQCFRFWSLSEVYLVLNLMTLFSSIFIGIRAEEEKHFCIYPKGNTTMQEKVCKQEKKGYGILITNVTLSTRPWNLAKAACSDLYADEETEDSPELKLQVEKACNGLDSCRSVNFQTTQSWIGTYVVSYKCKRVEPKQPFDPNKPTFDIMTNSTGTQVTGTAVLSTRILGQEQPINRTCHAFGADKALTLKILHVDLTGDRVPEPCSGQMNVTSGLKELFSVNCSQTDSVSYSNTTMEAEAGSNLTVSLSLKKGFVWLEIDAGESTFTISCNGTSSEGKGKQRIHREPNEKPIPFPTSSTQADTIVTFSDQPLPTTSTNVIPTSTTRPTSTIVVTTTSSKFVPKERTGSITVLIAIVSAIAGVATTVAVVLAVYLCKTRDSPYQRWIQMRQSRIVAAQDGNSRPKPRHFTNQEYAYVEPMAMRISALPSAAADSGMYNSPVDSSIESPFAPSPRPLPTPDQAHHPYINEGTTQASVGQQGMMYSEVVMTNPNDDGVKIYAPGFYHTFGNKDPNPPPGGGLYDVMGATSGQYMHLKDTAVKENYLHKNVYDG